MIPKFTPAKKSPDKGKAYTKEIQDRLLTQGVKTDELTVKGAMELQGQRLKYSSSTTPLTMIRAESDEEESTALFLGDAEEAWEKLKEYDKIQGANWEISVMMGLSRKERRLAVGITLYTPALRGLDWKIESRSDHLDDKDAAAQVYSRAAGQYRFLLEEHDQLGKGIPATFGNILYIHELIALVRGLKDFSNEAGTVSGDPLVRMSLDGHLGVAFRLSRLDDPEYVDVIGNWVRSMVMFAKENRHMYWDSKTQAYSPKRKIETAPNDSSFSKILEELGNGL